MSLLGPAIGAVFAKRYEIIRAIGEGGMGAVFEVVDRVTHRHRALKVLLPGKLDVPDLRRRFQLEARVTAEIQSEHIVEVLDAGVDEETVMPFLVMELLDGADLAGVLAQQGHVPEEDVVRWLHQVALALEKTHAKKIVHRDLKPQNLFLTVRDDGTARIKILDFGLAKLIAEGSEERTMNHGTPLYMPPEQLRGLGNIDGRADLYAVAHIAYQLLSGEPYWMEDWTGAGAFFNFMRHTARGPAEPPSERAQRRNQVTLPKAFDAWFLKGAAAHPDNRYSSAMTMISDLADAVLPAA